MYQYKFRNYIPKEFIIVVLKGAKSAITLPVSRVIAFAYKL